MSRKLGETCERESVSQVVFRAPGMCTALHLMLKVSSMDTISLIKDITFLLREVFLIKQQTMAKLTQ